VETNKDALTTGEVAKICNVAPRTVSKWFDSGQLRGYRIPGSRDRRIPVQQLVRFMKAHNIPLNGLDPGNARILIADADREFASTLADLLRKDKGYDVRIARTAFEAGAFAAIFKPHAMLVDTNLDGMRGNDIVCTIRSQPDIESSRLIAVTNGHPVHVEPAVRVGEYDAVLSKPFGASEAITTIEKVLGHTRS
jgi:excisionase family DNA binding protein